MNRIIYASTFPFKQGLSFFLTIWLLASGADVFFWALHGNPVFGAYMGIHGFIECYLITFIAGLLPVGALRFFKPVLLILGYVNLIADALVHNIMHFSFTADMVAIILGSNVREASEFLPMYFTPGVIGFISCVIIISLLVLIFVPKLKFLTKKVISWIGFAVLLAGTAVIIVRKSNNWEGLFLNKIMLFINYDSPVDLKQYSSLPSVSINGEQPENIVLIIGESLSKSHCSIYGYPKPTQPLLQFMLDDSLIVAFPNVEAAWPNTVESFKSMMSTYKPGNPAEDWYSTDIFLTDAMKAAGYSTYWISNQSSVGLYDNIVAKFAQLADTTIWTGTKGMGIGKHDPDGLVVPVVRSIASASRKKFIVVHLMGSHEGFSSRYPSEYAHFKAADYSDRPDNQRQLLAEYDNSILYNDYVVSSLIDLFNPETDVVIYLPDHGLDVFESDSEYAGHARVKNEESFKEGISIPFIMTNTGQLKIDNRAYFNTEDLFGLVCKIANISVN